MSACDWSRASRTRPTSTSSCSVVLVGLAIATSMSVRMEVSGVRSSCEALATNLRWLAKARSRRFNMSSKVSASSLSSSSGPSRLIRSSRRSWEARRAAVVTLEGEEDPPSYHPPQDAGNDGGDGQTCEGPHE